MSVNILSHDRFPPFGFQNDRLFNIGISIISIVLHGILMCCKFVTQIKEKVKYYENEQ